MQQQPLSIWEVLKYDKNTRMLEIQMIVVLKHPTSEEGTFVLKANINAKTKTKTKSTPKDAVKPEENTKIQMIV